MGLKFRASKSYYCPDIIKFNKLIIYNNNNNNNKNNNNNDNNDNNNNKVNRLYKPAYRPSL